MDFLASVALSSVIVIVLLICAGFVFVLWQQGAGDQRPVLIDRMLRRQGEGVAYRAVAAGGRDFALAVNQCVVCQKAAECRSWLLSGATDGYESFCPNTGFIQRVKRISA
ncbi:MAG TPA: DUF6455 family protein [Burkholderiales bacterium]|jgi:hypothetical protein|nr:DUF6455 family protein [Burkholderiales bacterium]